MEFIWVFIYFPFPSIFRRSNIFFLCVKFASVSLLTLWLGFLCAHSFPPSIQLNRIHGTINEWNEYHVHCEFIHYFAFSLDTFSYPSFTWHNEVGRLEINNKFVQTFWCYKMSGQIKSNIFRKIQKRFHAIFIWKSMKLFSALGWRQLSFFFCEIWELTLKRPVNFNVIYFRFRFFTWNANLCVNKSKIINYDGAIYSYSE